MRLTDLWDAFFPKTSQRKSARVRLRVEQLEDRCTPTANASGLLSGLTFIDANTNGIFDTGDAPLPGVTVSLTGTTAQAAAVSATAVTDANGAFNFLNVLPGTYSLNAGAIPGFATTGIIGGVSTPTGVNIVNN